MKKNGVRIMLIMLVAAGAAVAADVDEGQWINLRLDSVW